MKKFLTCALCFMPSIAGAVTLYYTPGGECDGLYLNPAATGCPAESDRVVKLHVASRADADFTGYKVGNVEIIDSAGNVKSNAVETLVTAAASGNTVSKVTGNYECAAGTTANRYGFCSPDDEAVIADENGEEFSTNEVNCNYGTENYNATVCETVKVHLHDLPSHDVPSGISQASISHGNDGVTMWCNRVWCYEKTSSGTRYIEHINHPELSGYTFRGYYYDPNNNLNLMTDRTEMTSQASGHFFPKHLSDSPTNHLIYINSASVTRWPNPANNNSTSIQSLPLNAEGIHEIHLYGAWAKHCENDDYCKIEKGISLANTGGLEPGDVKYVANCPSGFHPNTDSGAGTYLQTCDQDIDDFIVNYTFQNQYGEIVDLSSTPYSQSCAALKSYNMLDTVTFNGLSGVNNNYALRWLRVNNEYYTPNHAVTCDTQTLGANPSNVTAFVCDTTCENVYRDSVQIGTCQNMTDSTTISFDVHGSGHYTGGHLWGENSGRYETAACQELICNQGYIRSRGTNGQMTCKTEYEICQEQSPNDPKCDIIGFECPTGFTVPDGVTIGSPVLNTSNSNVSCEYTVGCSDSDALLEHATSMSTKITCNGINGCTQRNVQAALNQYSCYRCMTTGFAYDTTLTVGAPTIFPNSIASIHSCTYRVWCRTGSYAGNSVGTVTCDSSGDNACRTPVGTTYYYNITNLINQYIDSCSGANPPVLDSCPTMTGNTGGPESNSSSWGAVTVTMAGTPESGCTYTVSCANQNHTLVQQSGNSGNYAYNPIENGTTTVTCNGNNCTTGLLSPQIDSYYCRSGD